jgi:hypothetical protein
VDSGSRFRQRLARPGGRRARRGGRPAARVLEDHPAAGDAGIIVAVFLAFIAAFDEAQGTLIVGSPTIVTMPTLMYTLVVNYPQPVGAIFSILLSAPSVVLLLIARRFLLGGYLAAGFKGR